MFRHFRTTLPAAALSTVLAITSLGGSAVPARADGRDAAAVLGGIIALYAIGRAIDDRNDRNSRTVPTRQYHEPTRPQQHHGSGRPRSHEGRDDYDRPRQHVAPARCYREFQTGNGYFRGYAGHCLERNTHAALPASCARDFRTNRGWRSFYSSRCLSQRGWVREGRRNH